MCAQIGSEKPGEAGGGSIGDTMKSDGERMQHTVSVSLRVMQMHWLVVLMPMLRRKDWISVVTTCMGLLGPDYIHLQRKPKENPLRG